MAAQELGSKRQVSVSAVPKHSNLLGAQCVPDKNLQNLDPGKKNSSAGSWRSPTACFGYLFFFSPRNPKFSSLLLRTHPKHPCTRVAKSTAENLSLAQWPVMPQWMVHLGSLHLLFPFPPPPPFLSSLSLRLKPTNLNSPQILICSSLPATHYLLCCLVNSKYWLL